MSLVRRVQSRVPGFGGTACLNTNKFCLQTVAGVRVCMCVFNSGMNLILILPTLGMGNSCLNELNSGFKIASICSPSEPAPSEATPRLGAHSSGSWSRLWGWHGAWGPAGPRGTCKARPATKQVPSPRDPYFSSVKLGLPAQLGCALWGTRSTTVGGSRRSLGGDRPAVSDPGPQTLLGRVTWIAPCLSFLICTWRQCSRLMHKVEIAPDVHT